MSMSNKNITKRKQPTSYFNSTASVTSIPEQESPAAAVPGLTTTKSGSTAGDAYLTAVADTPSCNETPIASLGRSGCDYGGTENSKTTHMRHAPMRAQDVLTWTIMATLGSRSQLSAQDFKSEIEITPRKNRKIWPQSCQLFFNTMTVDWYLSIQQLFPNSSSQR